MTDPFKRYETPWNGWNWLYGMYLVDPEALADAQQDAFSVGSAVVLVVASMVVVTLILSMLRKV